MISLYISGEGESLLTLHNIGKGIASGAEEDLSPGDSEGGASGEVQDPTGGEGEGITIADRKKLSMNDGDTVEGKSSCIQIAQHFNFKRYRVQPVPLQHFKAG